MNNLKVNDVIEYLDSKFDQTVCADWDNVGLQFKNDTNISLTGVVTCLDVTTEVVEEAIKTKSNLIISRHPFLFVDENIELKNIAKKNIKDLLDENNISIFSIHTNYDNSENQNLLNLLKEKFNIKSISQIGECNEIYEIEIADKFTAGLMVENFIEIFKSEDVKVSDNFRAVRYFDKFYICTGAGASAIVEHNMKDVYFITGEAKWHEYIYAVENDVKLICLGHYMENYFIYDIKNKLENEFKINVIAFDIKQQYRTW